MLFSLIVNISTKETINATEYEVNGLKINPLIAMLLSLGSYFKKSTRGIRPIAVATYAKAHVNTYYEAADLIPRQLAARHQT